MRSLRLLCLSAAAFLLSASASVTAANPAPGVPGSAMCQLTALMFDNGLRLTQQFDKNVFEYTCANDNSAVWLAPSYSTVAHPHLGESTSSGEVTFNGHVINSKAGLNAISNGGDVAKSPATESGSLDFLPGMNTLVIGVSCNGLNDPTPCYYKYTIRCDRPCATPEGSVVGDPQFVGLRGQEYQVHGVSGEVYNIVSDSDLQYNSRFVFLNQGECPVVNGKKQKGCFSHPGSYLGELGLKTRSGDQIKLISGAAKSGFAAVEVNGKAIEQGETVLLADNLGSISLNNTHTASVSIGQWDFVFENSDMYVNQKVHVADARSLRSHGLLGQTWSTKTYPNAVKHIAGSVDDYVIRDSDLFGDNFVFNKYN